MPIYEYQCGACGHIVEQLQKISDGPLVECPQCGKSEMQKIVSATSFQLKGTGWYATDFKTQPQAAKTDTPAPATAAAPATTATPPAAGETKTAAAPAAATKTDK
jgi:putative FmdB family regulatory protein